MLLSERLDLLPNIFLVALNAAFNLILVFDLLAKLGDLDFNILAVHSQLLLALLDFQDLLVQRLHFGLLLRELHFERFHGLVEPDLFHLAFLLNLLRDGFDGFLVLFYGRAEFPSLALVFVELCLLLFDFSLQHIMVALLRVHLDFDIACLVDFDLVKRLLVFQRLIAFILEFLEVIASLGKDDLCLFKAFINFVELKERFVLFLLINADSRDIFNEHPAF